MRASAQWSFVAWRTDAQSTTTFPLGVRFPSLGAGPETLEIGPAEVLRRFGPAGARALPRDHGVPRTGAFSPDASRVAVFFEKDGARGESGLALLAWPGLEEISFEPLPWASDYAFTDDGRMFAATYGLAVHFFDGKRGSSLGSANVGSQL